MRFAPPKSMKRLLHAAAVVLALPLTAIAQQPQQPERKPQAQERSAAAGATVARDEDLFDRLDANRDGYLSPAELEREAAAQANWIAADRNNDGRISRDEFTGIQGQGRK